MMVLGICQLCFTLLNFCQSEHKTFRITAYLLNYEVLLALTLIVMLKCLTQKIIFIDMDKMRLVFRAMNLSLACIPHIHCNRKASIMTTLVSRWVYLTYYN